MPDAPDPLGKRALFWAPAQRHEVGPRKPEERDLPGRHALFSTTGTPARNGNPTRARAPRLRTDTPRLRTDATVSRRSGGTSPGSKAPRTAARTGAKPVTAGARRSIRLIGLTCSKCGVHSDVDVVRYVTLHVPMWLWRPGRGYTRYMKCPACARRAWVSATWAPWRR